MNLNIPTELKDITLIQFMKYKEYLNANKEITEDQCNRKALSVFCNISMKEVDKIPVKDYKEIVAILHKAIHEDPKPLINTWNGLGFIPNLDKISLEEYSNLETYYSEDEHQIDKYLAVLYRPITQTVLKSYSIQNYDDELPHLDTIHQMPMDVCRSAIGFFLNLRDDLYHITLRYSKETQAKTTPQT